MSPAARARRSASTASSCRAKLGYTCTPMLKFPREFSDLLSPSGRRFLDGKEVLPALGQFGQRFVAFNGFIAQVSARKCLRILEAVFPPLLARMEDAIPPVS